MAGKCQVNLAVAPPDFWAINALKQMGGHFVATSGAGALITDGSWQGLLDDYGYPTTISGTVTEWRSQQLYIYGLASDVWVLDWQGSATVALEANGWTSGAMTESIVSSTRREYTLTGDPNYTFGGNRSAALLARLRITAISTSVSNIRLYRKEHETLINGSGATSLFNPDFLSRASGFGVLRFMDWLFTNPTRLTRWQDRHVLNDVSWQSNTVKSSFYFGNASRYQNTHTVSTMPMLADGQPVAFVMPARPVVLNVLSVTVGNPTTIQFTAAHGLSSGDKIQVDFDQSGGGSWLTAMTSNQAGTGLPLDFVVTATASDTVTIPFNSTGFAAPSTFGFHPIVQITDGSQTKKCYRKGMTLYFNSEWGSGATYPREVCAVYNADFDAFILSGNGNGDLFYHGIPYEAAIALCNYLNCSPHVNIPFVANVDFATQLATLVKSSLNSSLTPLFEKGNEIWNTGSAFWSTSHASNFALRNYSSASANLGYGKKVNDTSDAIAAVYGSQVWDMGFGVQGGGGWPSNRWEGNSTISGGTSVGYPINKVDVVLIAPYLVVPWALKSNAAAYSGLASAVASYKSGDTTTGFNWMRDQLDNPTDAAYIASFGRGQDLTWWTGTQIPVWQAKINTGSYVGRTARGLRIACYEGGQGCNAGTGATSGNGAGFLAGGLTSGTTPALADWQAFWKDFMVSAQMAEVMQRYCRRLLVMNVVPSQYYIAGTYDVLQNWGCQILTPPTEFQDAATPAFNMLKLVSSGKRRMAW